MTTYTNSIAQFLNKPATDFTRRDIARFIKAKGIEMLNFRYLGGDGRLKTLNLVVGNRAHLERILDGGERVDGSSLLPYIDTASSDLYVIPRYRTAYVNPFAHLPTIDILCSYYTSDGMPLASSPENILRKAHEALKQSTGLSLKAMGELEYYVLYRGQHPYPVETQKGYHESAPFSQGESLRCEAMQATTRAGLAVKYGHSEVGNIHADGCDMEQQEIELLPVPIEDAADQIVIAKWMLRMTAYKHGLTVTFAPKILAGQAGSGLHIHTKLTRNGHSVMTREGQLTDIARKTIAGYLSLAGSLTAFGNTVPTSYLRLVPHQEAPTNICWGSRNRSVLVRVPLGWSTRTSMAADANPQDKRHYSNLINSQTVEIRSPDGSANAHLLLAGLTVAARYGQEMKDALEVANKLYVDVNIFSSDNEELRSKLPQLPSSCWESAECLLKDRGIYEQNNVFAPVVIDRVVEELKAYDDRNINKPCDQKEDKIKGFINRFLHCA